MAFDAAAPLRAIELTSYSVDDLVNLLCTTNLKTDFNAVATVLKARERRAAQAEAQLKATLDDAMTKIQVYEDLRRASLAEAEDSARLQKTAEEEAHAIIMAAVSEIHEAGRKKLDEVSAHLDAALEKIHALLHRQREDLPADMAKIVEETEAKLKASFSKIHASLNPPAERDGVPGQETNDDTALAMITPSIPVARDGGLAAADGSCSVGKSLKRKTDAVENRGVSPVQISRELQENMEDIGAPSSRIYDKAGPYSYNPLSQPIKVSAKVSNAVASVEGSGKTVTLIKEPTPLERSAPTEATIQDEPAHVGGPSSEVIMEAIGAPPGFSPTPRFSAGLQESMEYVGVSSSYSSPSQAIKVSAKVSKEVASVQGSGKTVVLKEPTPLVEIEESMSLFTVPVQQDERLERARVSKRGRGRGRAVAKDNKRNKNVSEGSGSLGSGHGRSITSTVLSAPPVEKCSANGSQSRNGDIFLQSNASATGQAKTNIPSGQATAGTRGLVLEDITKPGSSLFRIRNISMAELRGITGIGNKVTENLGRYAQKKADSVQEINKAAERTSHEEGDVGGSSTGTGGASRGA